MTLPLGKEMYDSSRRDDDKKYIKSQMDLARRLDKKCMNKKCDKGQAYRKLDPHHILGRAKEFLSYIFIILLCRKCHIEVGEDIDLMIKILEAHMGKHYFRWTSALKGLKEKRDRIIYKRGQDEVS